MKKNILKKRIEEEINEVEQRRNKCKSNHFLNKKMSGINNTTNNIKIF